MRTLLLVALGCAFGFIAMAIGFGGILGLTGAGLIGASLVAGILVGAVAFAATRPGHSSRS